MWALKNMYHIAFVCGQMLKAEQKWEEMKENMLYMYLRVEGENC